MSPIVRDPADAVVYAPDLERASQPLRAPWDPGDDARLVVSVLLHAPCYDDDLPAGVVRPAAMQGGVGRETGEPRHGQVARLSQWDFGLTVGVFRLLTIAERLGVPVAVALDARGARRMPGLAAEVAGRAGEVVARGRSANQVMHAAMSDPELDAYVREGVEAVSSATGRTVTGWFSPERATAPGTTRALRAAGLSWFGDWPVDERPVAATTSAGPLTALPFGLETEDVFALYTRGLRVEDYAALLDATVDRLLADAGTTGPRFLGLSWFGWVLGQACFADVAEQLLARLLTLPGVRLSLPGQVARP